MVRSRRPPPQPRSRRRAPRQSRARCGVGGSIRQDSPLRVCQPAADRIANHPDDLAILTKFTRMCHQTIAVAPKWCHSDAMDLTPYVDNLRHELAVAAEAGGEDAKALADRLTAPLESAVRLTLLDALSAAAAEITRDLAPGSVDLRLRGREPEFVVAPAISEPVPAPVEEDPTPAPRPVTESDDAR